MYVKDLQEDDFEIALKVFYLFLSQFRIKAMVHTETWLEDQCSINF